jgi:FecR-like protein
MHTYDYSRYLNRATRVLAFIALTFALLAGWRFAARADSGGIPDLALLTTQVRQAHPGLIAKRATLASAIATFNGRVRQFNAACGSVDSSNTAAVQSCSDRQAQLKAQKRGIVSKIIAFNAEVRGDMSGTSTQSARAPAQYVVGLSIRGEVFGIKSDGVRRRLVGSAAHMEAGERILTSPNSRLQVLLPDETVFTLGPNSDMRIDEFVYDPNTSAGKMTAHLAKGIFRFVTGKVQTNRYDSLKIWVPRLGCLGFRGTDVQANVAPSGAGYILLRTGALDVTNKQNKKILNMSPGQIVFFSSDGTFTAPRILKAGEVITL